MKFIKQFATDELMNEAALQIHHKDGAFVYQSQSIKFIDEKRTTLVGSGFGGNDCWSSREYSSRNEYFVTLYNGELNYNYKDGYRLVLGFLALEY